MVFTSSSYVKAYEDDDFAYQDSSNTSLSQTSMELYIGNEFGATGKVTVINPPEYLVDFDFECSNPALGFDCYYDFNINTIVIFVENPGTGRVIFTINNNLMYLDIVARRISINKTSILLEKKKKTTIKMNGYPKAVNWIVKNKKVATVSSSGKIKGKKIGNTLIYTNIGGQYFGCAVSVVSKKMNKIIKTAYKIRKGKYSQAKRMKKGYYDCSSLVWRSYKKAKVKLANKYYAPVAADLAKYFVKKKKRIKGGYSNKNISKMKLKPGDLFFCEGMKNKRYRGIYHVEMFTGYRCVGMDENGKATLVARWATVRDDYYSKDKGLMVRPIK